MIVDSDANDIPSQAADHSSQTMDNFEPS